MPRPKNQWIRCNTFTFDMYSDMGKPKTKLFFVLFVLVLCMRTATGTPALHFTVSEVGRRITISDSGQFGPSHHTSVPWSFRCIANLVDMYSRSDFLAEFRLAIRFPRFGYIKTSFGDLIGDARIRALMEGGFRLDMDRTLEIRELVARPIAIDGKSGGFITIGTNSQLPISAHLFLQTPLSETSRVGVTGAVFEFPLRKGIVRTALALVRERPEDRDSWVVRYHHEPIGTGLVGYWSWVGTCLLPRLQGSLHAGLLHRVVYDRLLGFGSSTVVLLELEQGQWAFSFKRLDIDAFAGSVGSVSTSTEDSPQQELSFSAGFEGTRMRFDMSLHDKRWRPTVFAGASQRRTVSASTEVGYHADSWDGGISLDSTYRWNRSGTRSRTHTVTVKYKCLVRGIHLSCEPEISVGKKLSLDGSYALEKSIPGFGTVRAELVHTAWKAEVEVSFRARLSVGVLEFSLGSSGEVSVKYSIVPKG